jgi:hypothetical protein
MQRPDATPTLIVRTHGSSARAHLVMPRTERHANGRVYLAEHTACGVEPNPPSQGWFLYTASHVDSDVTPCVFCPNYEQAAWDAAWAATQAPGWTGRNEF